MTTPLHTICICGGGNLGHTITGYVSSKSNYKVRLLTTKPEAWSNKLLVTDCHGKTFQGNIQTISDKAEETVTGSNIILLCVPGFAIEEELLKIKPYLKPGQLIGSIVSSTGFFFIAQQHLPASIGTFGFQRVPFISRINHYGHSASLLGYKKQLIAGIKNISDPEPLQAALADMFDTPVSFVHHYLEVSLSNSNPLLHTTRLYNLFKNYQPDSTYYDRIPLFYEEWTDKDSELLIQCDAEFFQIVECLPITAGAIQPILEYYESQDKHSLTEKIRSIEAFKGLESPMKSCPNGKFVPDFNSRYFKEDFCYGLSIIQQIGHKLKIKIPYIDQIQDWANQFIQIPPPNIQIDL